MQKPINFKIISFKSLESTNNYAKNLIQTQKAENGMVIQTDYQTIGRGQFQKKWQSSTGKNILISIILNINLPIQDQFYLNMITALACSKLFKNKINENSYSTIKWPNDLMFKDKKIGGILIENFIQGQIINHTVIGIGLNINEEDFKNQIFKATSLSIETGKQFDILETIHELLIYLNEFLLMYWNKNKFDLLDIFNQNLFKRNEFISYFDDEKKRFPVKILGINEMGYLIVNDGVQEMIIKSSSNIDQYNC